MTENNNQQLIESLREMALFLEARPKLPKVSSTMRFDIWCFTKEAARAVARMVGGKLTKDGSWETYMILKRQIGTFSLEINITRKEVCERVVVGTRTIEATPEQILPATPEREEEIIEWRCDESILKENEQ